MCETIESKQAAAFLVPGLVHFAVCAFPSLHHGICQHVYANMCAILQLRVYCL